MEGNTLELWNNPRFIVVLEGALVPGLQETMHGKLRPKKHLPALEEWSWSTIAIKSMKRMALRENVGIEVVTFISAEAAEMAADWMQRYGVDVQETLYSWFSHFCESLKWRTDIAQVIDSNKDRLQYYGQHGYQVYPGREW